MERESGYKYGKDVLISLPHLHVGVAAMIIMMSQGFHAVVVNVIFSLLQLSIG